jgi:phosphohistidine phosphatase
MQIYLIRHAHALDGDDDAARPLSRRGKKQIREMAVILRRSAVLETREFWHSPLVRAHDTARLLARWMGVRAKFREVSGLEPVAKPALMVRRLAKRRQSVALVGHEPHLSALAALLLSGRGKPPMVVMKKCAVLALERTGGRWAVRWLVSPEVFSRRP